MPLSPASRFGPYEILGPLGAGGMGEVYRASDTRLGREVALKVLPSDVSADPTRRARFEQEARAAAALNHPNIVGLHDVGEENGVAYIVSELVPGETLAALLQDGPLPVRKLLDIAVQIADGMAAAHAARITHRDLKPANLIVTPEGRVKILDFGLAKQTAAAAAVSDATVTVRQTQPGVIMGTVHYMSPEQARGRSVDHRSDQFSFGLILYEMATGRKAFDRPENVQILLAILTDEPPPIERDLPAPLRWKIDRLLAKDPAERYESTGDLFRELRQIRDHYSTRSASQTATVTNAPASRWRIRWVFPVIGTAGLIATFFLARSLAPQRFPDQSAYRFTPFSFDPGGQTLPIWSPDGKAIAYQGHPDGAGAPAQIMVRYLDQAQSRRVTKMSREAVPIGWTPDSARILFWCRQDPAGLWSASVVGGEPESFMAFDNAILEAVAPDAKSVAVLRSGDDGVIAVWTASPPGTPLTKYPGDPLQTRIIYNQPRLQFSPDGASILVGVNTDRHEDELWLLPYPPDSGRPPRRILPAVQSFSGLYFTWMPDSRRVLLSLSSAPDTGPQLWLADLRSGARTQITSGSVGRFSTSVSPQGDRLVFSERLRDFDVVSVDLTRGAAERLISTGLTEVMPAWAANTRALAYISDRGGRREIWLRDQAGDRPVAAPKDFPPGSTQYLMGPALSPDGSRVAYTRIEYTGPGHLWISSTSGGVPVRLTNDDSSTEFPGSWSPDGAWFVYNTLRLGSSDLLKVKTSGQAAPVVVKTGAANETPSWSPAGDWILSGHHLISPDGRTDRELPNTGSPVLTFSRDGKLLYGIRHERDAEVLLSIDAASGAQKTIARLPSEFQPRSDLRPSLRLSISPDGGSIAYSAVREQSNLWMLEGAIKP